MRNWKLVEKPDINKNVSMIDKTTIGNKDLNQLIKRNKFQFAMTQVENSNLLLKNL